MATNNKLDKVGLSQLWAKILTNFVAKEEGKGLSANDLTDELFAKLSNLPSDAQVNIIEGVQVNGIDLEVTDKKVNVVVPTGALASLNEVALTNLTAELQATISNKADKATTLAGYGIEDAYTKAEVDTKLSSVYKFQGTKATIDELPTENVAGDTYNITTAFQLTEAFMEYDAENPITMPAGTNVSYTSTGKWDCLAGIYDFSEFLKKSDIVDITEAEINEICVMPQ